MLAVSDTGVGMAPEVLERVFEPFFTTKEVGQGSGLGLSMVYGFAKQSGGHITVDSELGHGTTVKLYLPRSAELQTTTAPPPAQSMPRGRGEVVLVVEDDPDILELTASQLESLGYRTLVAKDGRACAEVLETTAQVDLLLTDVVLPLGISGIKVLFMSGYAEDAIGQDGQLDDDAPLLTKPFRKAALARAIRALLDGQTRQ